MLLVKQEKKMEGFKRGYLKHFKRQRRFLQLLSGRCRFNLQLLVFNSTSSFLWKQNKTEKEYSNTCAIKLSFYEMWEHCFIPPAVLKTLCFSLWSISVDVMLNGHTTTYPIVTDTTAIYCWIYNKFYWRKIDSDNSLWNAKD